MHNTDQDILLASFDAVVDEAIQAVPVDNIDELSRGRMKKMLEFNCLSGWFRFLHIVSEIPELM